MRVKVEKSDQIPELHHFGYREYLIGEYSFGFAPMKYEWGEKLWYRFVFIDGPYQHLVRTDDGKVFWGTKPLPQEVKAYVEAIVEKDWQETKAKWGFQ